MMKKGKIYRSVLALALAAVLLAGHLPAAEAASSAEIRKQIEALEDQQEQLRQEYSSLQNQYQDNENEIEDLVGRKDIIDQEISLLNQEIELTNEQIAAYGQLIADKQDELDAANEDLQRLQEENRERVRSMEEDGLLSYWSVIFGANSFTDLLARLTMIDEIADSDQRRLEALDAAALQVAQAQEELEDEKTALEDVRQEQTESQALLEEKRADADELLQELVEKEEEFQRLLDESEALQDELMQEIAEKEDAYDKAAYQEWLATSIVTTKPTQPTQRPQTGHVGSSVQNTPKPPSSSGWQCPLSSYVLTSPFGMRLHPTLGYYRMHNGIDMAAPAMTPIYAARSGQVTVATYQSGGAGYYVSINHGDGYSSIYMHMTYFVVGAGDYVQQGQVIGYVGNTGGISTGNHLHFGISYNGSYVNPLLYI